MDEHEHTDGPDEPDRPDDSAATDGEPEGSATAPATPSFVDGRERHVDPSTVRVGRIVGLSMVLSISAIPLILVTIGWATGGIPSVVSAALLAVWVLLLVSFLLLTYHWPAVRYRHLLYLVEDDGLRIRRGVFWRKVIWIPITRVQHTDVSQGPIQRRLGVGTLTIHTAGTAGSSIDLPGLEHHLASRLSDHLRPAARRDGN